VRRALAVARKELCFLLRDPAFLALQLAFPTIFLLLFGFTFSAVVKRVPVAVADLDRSSESRALLREMASSAYFELAPSDRPTSALARGEALAALEIAPGFGRDVRRGQGPELQLILDGSDLVSVRAAQGYVDSLEKVMASRASLAPAPQPALQISAVTWFNPELSDALFFVPGVVALLLCGVPTILSSLTLIREKELGTWDALRSTPLTDVELLAGKLLPYLLQALVLATALLAVALTVLKVPFRGSVGVVAGASALFVITNIAAGAIISAVSAAQDAAWRWICLAVLMPGIVLSGFIYPITSLPPAARAASRAFPVRTYLEVLRGALLKGADAQVLAPQLFTLGAFCLGALLLAVLVVRRARRAS
jgi:ABC-2 type transport system permease protein